MIIILIAVCVCSRPIVVFVCIGYCLVSDCLLCVFCGVGGVLSISGKWVSCRLMYSCLKFCCPLSVWSYLLNVASGFLFSLISWAYTRVWFDWSYDTYLIISSSAHPSGTVALKQWIFIRNTWINLNRVYFYIRIEIILKCCVFVFVFLSFVFGVVLNL